MSELILIAASGLAREVLAMVRSSGQYDVVGLLDDDKEMAGVTVDGAPVLGTIDDAPKYTHAFVLVCLGSGKSREVVVERLTAMGLHEARYATAIDPSVQCPEGCRIGRGSILLRNVTLTASVTLGSHVIAGRQPRPRDPVRLRDVEASFPDGSGARPDVVDVRACRTSCSGTGQRSRRAVSLAILSCPRGRRSSPRREPTCSSRMEERSANTDCEDPNATCSCRT